MQQTEVKTLLARMMTAIARPFIEARTALGGVLKAHVEMMNEFKEDLKNDRK